MQEEEKVNKTSLNLIRAGLTNTKVPIARVSISQFFMHIFEMQMKRKNVHFLLLTSCKINNYGRTASGKKVNLVFSNSYCESTLERFFYRSFLYCAVVSCVILSCSLRKERVTL